MSANSESLSDSVRVKVRREESAKVEGEEGGRA